MHQYHEINHDHKSSSFDSPVRTTHSLDAFSASRVQSVQYGESGGGEGVSHSMCRLPPGMCCRRHGGIHITGASEKPRPTFISRAVS